MSVGELFAEANKEVKRLLKLHGRGAIIKYMQSGRECTGRVVDFSISKHPRVLVEADKTKNQYTVMSFNILNIGPELSEVRGHEEQIDIFQGVGGHG